MALSSLDVTLTEIRNELTRFFQDGRSYGSSPTGGDVDAAIKRGLRQFYTPPVLPGDRVAHIWSFLYPESTITVFGDLTGTATTDPWGTNDLVDSAAEDVNNLGFQNGVDADGFDLVGQLISMKDVSAGTTFTDNGATPPIKTTVGTVSSQTAIITAGTAINFSSTPTSSTTDTYVITVDGNYILPKDFGGIVGTHMTFDVTTGFGVVEITSASRILALRQDNRRVQTFRPRLAAVRPISVVGGQADPNQRWEVMLWPTPDTTYTLHYQYLVQVDDIGTTGTFSPPGGMAHGETIMASCLAMAETMLEPAPPVRRREEAFMRRLIASVSLDRQIMSPSTLGIAGDATGDVSLTKLDLLQRATFGGVEYS